MKILDIRSFREYFKSHIRQTSDTNRNPHFAGHSREMADGTEFGFFDLYHGVKPDMENLLKTILDMARDSQALYEFMQNAVDAQSSDFLLFHHMDHQTAQHYLVVLNNGKPFDLKGILAILNIGASNKYRDVNAIGQFGVGFKLAHRLVGEETGLKALLEENKGPVLFSWQYNELVELAGADGYENVDPLFTGKSENANYNSNAPWLLKILYTNFPCTPGDLIIDAREKVISDAFSPSEQRILKEVAQQCLVKLEGSSMGSGTLLLIPLHENKVQELTEDAHRYGLEISTAILNQRSGEHPKLERIILNGQQLNSIAPFVELFRFEASDFQDQQYQTRLFDTIDTLEIDFLYEDPLEDSRLFTGKPQFYLYFPMTEERHGFRFAVHCNAFSFTSARTALQENTVRNKKVFELLVDGIGERLKGYAESDQQRFERLYLSLLLSERGDNDQWKENRQWLEKELWEPMTLLLENYLPVRSTGDRRWRLALQSETVTVKDSALPLEQWTNAGGAWALWDGGSHPEISHKLTYRLGLDLMTLVDVIKNGSAVEAINAWLAADIANSYTLLGELEERYALLQGIEKNDIKDFWDNFAKLRLWEFMEGRASIEELSLADEHQNKLIAYGPLEELVELLELSTLRLSRQQLSSFPQLEQDIRARNSSRLDYLRSYRALNVLLSAHIKVPGLYSPHEKRQIFLALNRAVTESNSVAERVPIMKVLALFENQRHEVKPLQALVQGSVLPMLLAPWHVKKEEVKGLKVEEYTAIDETDIYDQVVLPYWEDIVAWASKAARTEVKELFDAVRSFYQKTPTSATLSAKPIFISSQGLVVDGVPTYYHDALGEFSKAEYAVLAEICEDSGIGMLPLFELLGSYSAAPFSLKANQAPVVELPADGIVATSAQASAFIKLFQRSGSDGLDEITFVSAPGGMIGVKPLDGHIVQVATLDKGLAGFIGEHASDRMALLPESLVPLARHIGLVNEQLLSALIELDLDQGALSELLHLVRDKGTEAHKEAILGKFADQLPVDIGLPLAGIGLEAVKLVLGLADKDKRAGILGRLAVVNSNGKSQHLDEITSKGSDELAVTKGNAAFIFSIAALLDDGAGAVNQQLTSCAYAWAAQNVATLKDIEEALGLSERREPPAIWEALLMHLPDGLVENGEQLAFLLCYGSEMEELPEGLYVETLVGPMPLFGNTFYLNNEEINAFIPASSQLSERYQACRDIIIGAPLLELEATGTRVLLRPYFKSGELVFPGVDRLDEESGREVFRSFLYRYWESGGRPMVEMPAGLGDWMSLIGFEPSDWIIAESMVLEEERVDESLFASIGADREKLFEFLTALGAHTAGSPLILWRSWMIGGGELPNLNLTEPQVHRTLKWLEVSVSEVVMDRLFGLYAPLSAVDVAGLRLPAYLEGRLRICSPSDSLFFMDSAQQERLVQMDIDVQAISRLCGLAVIPPFKGSEKIWAKVAELYLPLGIEWDSADEQALMDMGREWTFAFYEEWSARTNRHIFDIPGQVPRLLTVQGSLLAHFNAGDAIAIADGERVFVNGELNILVALERMLEIELLTAQDEKAMREAYQESSSRLTSLLERIKGNDELADALDRLLDYAQQQQEKEAAARRLQDRKNFYSMQWFEDLLDLVRIQERISSAPSVEFSGIRLLDNATNIYELSRPSERIPSDIETYDYISAKITYRDDQGTPIHFTTLLEATRKSQSLWVRFTDIGAAPVLQRKVISVTLSFARATDLIHALRRGMASLNYPLDHNLKETLSENIDFLFGPPGTGKTTEVAKRLIARAHDSPESGPIIVLTPTNKAADVLAKKIIAQLGGAVPDWLVRFGTCTDPELLAAGAVGQREADSYINEGSRAVLITTIHRFAYDKVFCVAGMAEKTPLSDCPWSLVVFDEASMIPLPYIAYAIHRRALSNSRTAFLVAGDPLQIPPVFDLISEDLDNADQLQKENIYTMVGLDSFDTEVQLSVPVYGENGRIENLTVQHRSVPVIGELFGQFQYGGRIGHSRGTAANSRAGTSRPLPGFFADLGIKPVTVVRYKVGDIDSIYDPKRLNNSPIHLYSALMVNEFLKRFQKEVEAERAEKWSVGVISPYRSQAVLMDKMVEDSLPYCERMEVNIDTVHGFQGDENQMVLAVLNPGNANAQYSRFLNEAHILNVAISRAEDYLILFVPDEDTAGLCGLPLIAKGQTGSILEIISKLPKELCAEIDAPILEQALMGEKRYFERYARTTAHLPVNVYRELQTPYLFRISGNAVDVHWRSE